MDLCHDILSMARTDVPLMAQYAVVRYGWSSILDAMVGACLNLGNRGRAEQYHQELLDMGATPSANTFGLYITTLKDSTKTFDEASEAVRIFHRAKAEGVEPSSFLYNALIGKLGKARRIDDCLFFFAEMRALGIKPTSVTYGTVVNALCRVSDEKFAEELFDEMEGMPNYKPRPAPYNSMMQFFLTTKRDKSKVLAYYERMKTMGIAPTSHTYKLLIDTHATLEPVNMSVAEEVLDGMRSAGQRPEPVHFASLIHSRGCVLHDMEGARRVFDSLLQDATVPLNAGLYQALFEAMVANHCVADTEPILEQMKKQNIELTPYIANTLIHGWATANNIDKAQSIYDAVGRSKREPSTYESMTRAFLSAEQRDQAQGVVSEMLTRGYPSAVVNKVLELLGGGQEALLD
jgi:pentatricopeptide repeat protein